MEVAIEFLQEIGVLRLGICNQMEGSIMLMVGGMFFCLCFQL